MKQHIAIVIAALMIASMATAISTSTVIAPSTFSVSPGVSISPTSLATDKYTILTLNVSNDTGDDIARVLVRLTGFTNPLGGADNSVAPAVAVSDNWVEVAKNLENVSSEMTEVTENLENATAELKLAGMYLKQAGENLKLAGFDLQTSGRENVNTAGTYIYGTNRAAEDLIAAANLLSEPFDLDTIQSYLDNASADLALSATALAGDTDATLKVAGDVLTMAKNNLVKAAIEIQSGQFGRASENMDNVDTSIEWVGENLAKYTGTGSAQIAEAGRKIENFVFPNLTAVKNSLSTASSSIRMAGHALDLVDNYLKNTLTLRMNSATTTLSYVTQLVIDNFKGAADSMLVFGVTSDNIRAGGASLVKAATELAASNAAATAFNEFGGSDMADAADYLTYAGDNLESTSLLDITTAVANLTSFATSVDLAAATIEDSADAVSVTDWVLHETATAYTANWTAIGENYIASGASKTFKFLWLVPSITTVETYTAKVWTYGVDNVQTSYEELSLTVDGEMPTVEIAVSQTGVTIENLLKAGSATITITASKALSELGTVYVEDSGTGENLIGAVTMSTSNHITYTGTFTVGEWDDNIVQIRVEGPSATDESGNENPSDMTDNVLVDTRAPIFVENGLSVFTNLVQKVQPGTNKTFYTDNVASHTIHGRVEDNASARWGYDNADQDVVKVYVGSTLLVQTENNDFEKATTQSEGLNAKVTIRAVDWAGNETEVYTENVFIDTKVPEITFNTITKKSGTVAWTDGIVTNDNTPAIKLTMLDPGYPNTGLGVINNFQVWLLNIENGDFSNTEPATIKMRLENKNLWSITTGVFENAIENAGKGLKEGTYYVIAIAGDNLQHGGEDNVSLVYSFVVDVSAPSVPSPSASDNPISGSTISNPTVRTTTALTLSGSGAEVGATVNVYINDATTPTTTATVDSSGRWSATITLAAGVTTKIEVSITDAAGNESSRQLYGYVLTDGTAPSVSITAPVASGETYSTDQASIVVTGAIGKDSWESYNSGTYGVTATSQVGSTTAGTLTINSDGSYSISVALSEGTNSVSIRASDSAGNTNSAGITVTRTVTPWATYAIIIVIVALVLAAIAIFRKR